MKAKFLIYFPLIFIVHFTSISQEIIRPPIWGIAKMTFYTSNFNVAREYYGDFLGFEEVFSYLSKAGKVLSFKVNDRQFLEFIEDKDAKGKGFLASVSFECSEIGQMEAYLLSRDVAILKEAGIDGAGNQTFFIQSTEFYQLEFIHFLPEGLHKRSKGNSLGENRIANRLHHAGLYISDVEKADHLYREILGFKEMWRFKKGNTSAPNYIYLHLPDCIENIEFIFTGDSNSSHPCFRVDDMQETIYELKERKGKNNLSKPMIGKGNRWLLNMRNSDEARVEFTEAYTIR